MELPYDGDTNDPKQHCRHGTFIGSWWGPDILCGACEMGDEDEAEWAAAQAAEAAKPRCQWSVDMPSMDGEGFDHEYTCSDAAYDTLVVKCHFNPDPPHTPYTEHLVMCREHAVAVLEDSRVDGEVLRLGPDITLDHVLIAKVVTQ